VNPALVSSSAAVCTLSASTTSNSMLAWGAGRSAGHSGAPKQAGRSLGQRPNAEALAAVDGLTVQAAVRSGRERQSKRVDVRAVAGERIRRAVSMPLATLYARSVGHPCAPRVPMGCRLYGGAESLSQALRRRPCQRRTMPT
jgi:hypothetical protein